ncbi:MAG: hypothetical protein J6J24_03530 [Clostridia bacterium]|nr:hypothetical protein [Clostridia bacterium]
MKEFVEFKEFGEDVSVEDVQFSLERISQLLKANESKLNGSELEELFKDLAVIENKVENYVSKNKGMALDDVPDDIPEDVEEVYDHGIESLPDDDFQFNK